MTDIISAHSPLLAAAAAFGRPATPPADRPPPRAGLLTEKARTHEREKKGEEEKEGREYI